MLRALRFAARLGFAIEPHTRAAIDTLQQNIANISRERIGEELRKMLEHPTRLAAIELLATFPTLFTGVFGFPIEGDATDHDWPTLTGLPAEVRRITALMAILRDAGANDPEKILPQLRANLVLSNAESEALTWLSTHLPLLEQWEDLTKPQLKRLMASPHWKELETLHIADPTNADQLLAFTERIEAMRDEGVAPRPFINGATLIALGAAPGPQFKAWIDHLYDQQLNGDLPTPESALTAAKSLLSGKQHP
jgi:poly(A) polymerase